MDTHRDKEISAMVVALKVINEYDRIALFYSINDMKH